MAAAEVTTLIAGLAPQFSGNVALPALITMAQGELDATVFGSAYDLACTYYVLHLLSGDPDGGGGAVTSLRNGDQSISYAVSASDDDLDSTGWGKKLKTLMRSCIIGARTSFV